MVSRRRIKPLKSIVALVLALLLTVGQVLPVVPALTAQVHAQSQPVLTVTGTGLHQDVLIYEGDWSNYTEVVRYYSSNNNYDYHKIWKVKGYDLFELLGAQNLKTDQDYEVTFVAADGAPVTRKISELQSQYYYPQFTVESGQLVAPMLGFYRAALYEPDFQGRPDPDEIIWEDRELTEADRDANALRLHMGQAEGQVSENNQSYFLRDLVRIIVGEERPTDPGDDEFKDSPYKHINYEGPPYNIDTLTGATMTVEGPGMESYRALSLRQLEETAAEGLYRGTYLENIDGQTVENSYEGIRISYILDNYVTLRANVGKIVFKNYLRQEIAEFTLDEIRDESRMLIAAYGVNEVPFVYTNLDPGYIPSKYNDRGCLKLVYHPAEGEELPTFINVAYIYVEEDERPGYEHDKEPYNDPSLTQYIFTLGGSGLGKEVNYTTADLEAMTDLHLEKEYCLSNSYYYWYYNTYKGIPLWDLLLHAGMDPDIDENTPVHFKAADYYNIPSMTIGDIKHHDRWAYYEKNPEDRGDGTFDGSNEVPLETGYPVMVAFGFNGYPYVKHPTDPGYNSGLGNDGGPLRIIFGKRDYDHTNGSHQVKYAIRVIVGDDLPYTTHSYDPYDQLADETLTVTVVGEDGTTIKEEPFTVSEIEEMIYGEDVPAATADRARGKGYYFTHFAGGAGGTPISDLYEGIDLNYFLFEKIGLPGTVGTVTFTSSDSSQQSLVVSLEDIPRTDYFNEFTGVSGLKSILAFAKNGYPLVSSSGDPGYIGSPIVNRYGPLLALFGQTEEGSPGRQLRTVNSITVNMSTDPYAHLNPPYDQYAADELTISGDGVRKEHTVTVGELEFMQNYIFTGEYCLAKSETEKESAVYRGIDIYDFLRREVGFTAGADTITFKAADGSSQTFGLDEIAKADYINEITGAANLKVMLAFGKSEKPLVPSKDSEGYDAEAGNDGGPLRLVIGQTEAGDLNRGKSVKNVTEIIVNASAGDSWKHDYGVYTQYLDLPVLRVTGSQVKEPRTFSLRQLQALDEHIIRDIYMGETEVEGIIMWKLIKDVVGLADGVTIPSSIRVFDGPQYNQLHNVSQVMNGVVNSQGLTKEIILGYAINGYPLVPHAHSPGYVYNNEYGPLRVIVEENISMWTKWVDCIVVGEGDYEEPKAEDIITGPTVFTVSGGGVPGGSREYTLEQLQALGETTGEYSYTSGGELITDQATGVLLADILADLGITDPAWEISITATDGFDAGAVTLQEVIDQEYLVAYLVNGEPFEDTKDGYDSSTIRIYRRFNDGSNWRNRLTLVNGVIVTSTEPPPVFTISGDGVPGGTKEYTLEQLQALAETTASYSYQSKGSTVTVQATGVLLADILADLGITNPAWEIKLVTSDGYEHETYTVNLHTVTEDDYLVAYEVDGTAIDPAVEVLDLYRHHDDGSTWLNRAKDVCGVEVTSTDLELPWIYYRNDDGSGLPLYAVVRCITPDQKGGLWVGTNGAGAAYRDAEGNWTIYNTSNSPLPHNAVHGIAVDDADGVWFVGGSKEEGMGAVYMKDGNWTIYTSENSDLPADYGLDVAIDELGGVWFGTAEGLAYKDRNNVWRIWDTSDGLPAQSVTRIAFDKQRGGVWVGFHPEAIGEQGGYAYIDASGQVTPHTAAAGEPGTWIRSFSFDNEGGLWVSRFDTVDYIAPDGSKTVYSGKELVPFLGDTDGILYVEADQEGNLWIGLYPGGLLRLDPSGQLRTVASWLTAQFSVVWYMHTCPSGAFYTGGNGGIAMLPAPGPAGSNADLKSLTCSSGTLMPAFDPANTDYRILIADESAGVPEIGATVADTGRAVREIRNAASFTDKAQVTVTAEDGTQKIYTIGFMREILLPAPGTADDPAQVNVEVGEITDLYLDISPDDADKYAINITVPAGAETPTLMVNTVAVEGGRQAVLPAISIESSLSIEGEWQPVRVDIAAGTTVTGPADWDGVLQLPAVKEKPSVSIDGDVSVVLELGLLQGELLFDKAVRLHIPGQAGKHVGYIENGVFTEITRILSEDSQAYAEAQLPPGGDGKIDIGADLVVWTRHFTEFVTYTPAPEEPGPEPGDDEPGDDETPKDPLPRTWGGWTHLFMLFVAAFTLICGGLFISLNRRRTAGR